MPRFPAQDRLRQASRGLAPRRRRRIVGPVRSEQGERIESGRLEIVRHLLVNPLPCGGVRGGTLATSTWREPRLQRLDIGPFADRQARRGRDRRELPTGRIVIRAGHEGTAESHRQPPSRKSEIRIVAQGGSKRIRRFVVPEGMQGRDTAQKRRLRRGASRIRQHNVAKAHRVGHCIRCRRPRALPASPDKRETSDRDQADNDRSRVAHEGVATRENCAGQPKPQRRDVKY